jgi:molybdenum cofactor guanylyltransferase
MPKPSRTVAAVLLTGGKSRRLGQDKAQIVVGDTMLAIRTATLLRFVVEIAVEVGPGVSGLPSTMEQPPGGGPLAALAAGCRALRERGHTGSALAVACDLPLLSEPLLRLLIEWNSLGSVVPLVQGRPQPLCARWSAKDLDAAELLFLQGSRSLKHLTTQTDVVLLSEAEWGLVAKQEQFSDIDTPEDLKRLSPMMKKQLPQ